MVQLLIGLGTLALIFFLGVGYLCFRTGIVRREDYDRNYVPERDDPVPMSEHATEYRKRARPFNKWWNAQPLQRKTVVSEDGLKLAGGFLPAEEDHHKLAIVVHGHHCCAGEEGFISKMFHDAGFHVLAIDQRTHGASEGRFITMGANESHDVAIWARLMAEEHPDCRIVIYGASMGAATVCMTSALELPEQVVCGITDCGFTNAREVYAVEMERVYSFLPLKKFILELSSRISELVAKFRFDSADPEKAVAKATIPLLFLEGTADTQVPPYMVQRLYDAYPDKSKTEIHFFEGAGHNVSFFHEEDRYRELCLKFFERYAV